MMTTVSTIISVLALVVALASVYFAAKTARHARDTVTGSLISDISETFNNPDIQEGNRYLFDLRSNHHKEFSQNRYVFAREYLDKVDTASQEWSRRRTVARFWSRIGALLKTRLLPEDLVFTLFPDVEVIEILEPIEMAMVDKYGTHGDPYMALVYRRWLNWKKKTKHDMQMSLPLNPDLYEASKKQLDISERTS